jgi:transposase
MSSKVENPEESANQLASVAGLRHNLLDMGIRRRSLQQRGSLNRRSENVRDPLFTGQAFFDPEDLVQVKYEMLRRVRVDGESVCAAAASFGFSRPSFYAAVERFEREGLAGIIPRRPGPHEGSKLSEGVVDFLEELIASETPTPGSSELVDRVQERFGIRVHPRSIERALDRRRKKNSRRSG